MFLLYGFKIRTIPVDLNLVRFCSKFNYRVSVFGLENTFKCDLYIAVMCKQRIADIIM